MADRVVDRLIVAIKYTVDRASQAAAIDGGLKVATAITAATTAVVGWTIVQAAQIDATTKTARALGLTTEEYTRLAYAADRAGVSEQDLGASARALQMQLGAAASGSAEAAALFDRMGVEFADAAGNARRAADVLPELADGLARLPSDGARATAQLRLLSEGGAKLTSFFAGGSAAIRELTDRADKLGLTLDSGTGASAERLTDSMTDLRAVVRGAGLQLAGVLMPAVADGVDGLVNFAIASDGVVQVGLDRVLRGIGLAMDFARSPTGRYALAIGGLAGAVGAARQAGTLVGGLEKVSPLLGGIGKSMLAHGPKAAGYGLALAALALVIDDVIVTAQGGDSVIRAFADSMGAGEETAAAFASTGDLVVQAWSVVPGLLGGIAAIAGTLPSIFDGLPGPIKAVQEWLIWANVPLRAMIAGFQWMSDNLPSVAGAVGAVGKAVGDAAGGFALLARYMAGDESVQLSTQRRDTGPLGIVPAFAAEGLAAIGTATRATVQGQDVRTALDAADASLFQRLGATPSGAPPVSVSVNVSGDLRAAGRDAGRQVERELARVADALDQE